MAINPESLYPGKIAPSTADYPYGAARNITTPGDGTGTPWEAALVNDLFGFQQAILSEAAIVPSGTPEKATASQYLQALLRLHGYVATDISDLQNRTPYVDGQYAFLTDALRGGPFYWSSADHTSEVAIDTVHGIYIAPASDPTGASGAWVRLFHGSMNINWFGAIGDDSTELYTPLSVALALGSSQASTGSNAYDPFGGVTAIYFPYGKYKLSTSISLQKDSYLFEGDGPLASVIKLYGTANIIVGTAGADSANSKNVKQFNLRDIAIQNDSAATGSPMLDIDMASKSELNNVLIKNYNTTNAITTMRLCAWQWVKLDRLDCNGATKNALELDQDSYADWEAFLSIVDSQLTCGNALDPSVNAGIAVLNTGLYGGALSIATELRNVHISYYPADADFTKTTTYGIYVINGSTFRTFSMEAGGFENSYTQVFTDSDVDFTFRTVTFYGNAKTNTIIAADSFAAKWTFESCVFNTAVNAIMAQGVKHLLGVNRFSSITGTKIGSKNALYSSGNPTGLTLEKKIKADNIAVATTYVVSGLALEFIPEAINVMPSWDTTVWVDRTTITTDGFTINFGTAPPASNTLLIEATFIP